MRKRNWVYVSADEVADVVGNDALIYRTTVTEENVEELKEMISPGDQAWEVRPGRTITYWEGCTGDEVILFHDSDRGGVCLNNTVWGDLVQGRDGQYYIKLDEGDLVPIPAPRRWTRVWLQGPKR
ncbi:MAG: hypothetical protein KM310_10630 [Clostridiales bacterium]|nr:hypothetical protein [Clostridiales bacterium]